MEQIITTLALFDYNILAQAVIDDYVDKGLSTLTKISIILCSGGLILAGLNIIRGQIEFAVLSLIGSLTIGAAAVIAKGIFALFESL